MEIRSLDYNEANLLIGYVFPKNTLTQKDLEALRAVLGTYSVFGLEAGDIGTTEDGFIDRTLLVGKRLKQVAMDGVGRVETKTLLEERKKLEESRHFLKRVKDAVPEHASNISSEGCKTYVSGSFASLVYGVEFRNGARGYKKIKADDIEDYKANINFNFHDDPSIVRGRVLASVAFGKGEGNDYWAEIRQPVKEVQKELKTSFRETYRSKSIQLFLLDRTWYEH